MAFACAMSSGESAGVKSPDMHRWRLSASNAGSMMARAVSASMASLTGGSASWTADARHRIVIAREETPRSRRGAWARETRGAAAMTETARADMTGEVTFGGAEPRRRDSRPRGVERSAPPYRFRESHGDSWRQLSSRAIPLFPRGLPTVRGGSRVSTNIWRRARARTTYRGPASRASPPAPSSATALERSNGARPQPTRRQRRPSVLPEWKERGRRFRH